MLIQKQSDVARAKLPKDKKQMDHPTIMRGLRLRVYPRSKWWIGVVGAGGKIHRHLGRADMHCSIGGMSLYQAIEARAAGCVPNNEHKPVAGEVFEAVSERYLDILMNGPRPLSSVKNDRAALRNKVVLDVIGNAPLPAITSQQIRTILRKIEANGQKSENIKKRLSAFFGWATSEFIISKNPCQHVKATTSDPQPTILTQQQFAIINSNIINEPWGDLVALYILTGGQRDAAIREAEWSEINWDLNRWVIPAKRMKRTQSTLHIDHTLPLVEPLREKLLRMYRLRRNDRWLFPNSTNEASSGHPPRNICSRWNTLLQLPSGSGLNKTIRRTAFSVVAEIVSEEAADTLQGSIQHQRQGRRRFYNASLYLNQKETALEAWLSSELFLQPDSNLIKFLQPQASA